MAARCCNSPLKDEIARVKEWKGIAVCVCLPSNWWLAHGHYHYQEHCRRFQVAMKGSGQWCRLVLNTVAYAPNTLYANIAYVTKKELEEAFPLYWLSFSWFCRFRQTHYGENRAMNLEAKLAFGNRQDAAHLDQVLNWLITGDWIAFIRQTWELLCVKWNSPTLDTRPHLTYRTHVLTNTCNDGVDCGNFSPSFFSWFVTDAILVKYCPMDSVECRAVRYSTLVDIDHCQAHTGWHLCLDNLPGINLFRSSQHMNTPDEIFPVNRWRLSKSVRA